MPLGRDDATRILRFCLAGDGWGTAMYEDGGCLIKAVLNTPTHADVRQFQGATFEEALELAVRAGVLRRTSVEKQIAFLARASTGMLPPAGPMEKASPPPRFALEDDESLFPAITSVISALVHQTQRERGISSLYTASGGRLLAKELEEQWRQTDRSWRVLAVFRERYGDRLPADVAEQLAAAADLLATMVAYRARVGALEVIPTDLVESYSRLNREILCVVDLSSRVVDPAQRPAALAWLTLLHAKEKTGIERAQLASAFERDRFFDGQYQAVLGLIAARQSYLHLFATAAPAPAGRLLREKLGAEVMAPVERMEQIAVTHRDGGFGIDPTTWFAAISRQIAGLGELESSVRSSLTRTASL